MNYKVASNKQLLVELTLIKLCQLGGLPAEKGKEPEPQLKKIAPAPQQAPQQTVKPAAKTPEVQLPRATAPKMKVAANPPEVRLAKGTVPAMKSVEPKAPSLSLLHKGLDNAAAAKEEKEDETKPKKSPYTEKDFLSAWDSYIAEHPSDLILINAMRNSRPKQVEEDKYEIAVENPAQHDLVLGKIQEILSYLHDKLSNDNIGLDVVINQGEPSPYAWNDREVLDHMIEANPYLKEFMDDFRLTLS